MGYVLDVDAVAVRPRNSKDETLKLCRSWYISGAAWRKSLNWVLRPRGIRKTGPLPIGLDMPDGYFERL